MTGLQNYGLMLLLSGPVRTGSRTSLKTASHDSQMLVTVTYSQQMTEVISSTSSFDQLETAHVAFLPAKTVSSSFTGHRILTTISKNRNVFFFVMIIIIVLAKFQNYFALALICFYLTALAPASNDGKIITFLPSTCEWSTYRRLHVVGRLLVVITSI